MADALGLPPQRTGAAHQRRHGRRYSGVNPLVLQLAARRHGFRSKFWATFQQWKGLKCCVKPRPGDVAPGSWGTTAILYKPVTKTEIDHKTGEEKERAFPLLRTFTLFNADQVDGAGRWQVQDEPVNDGFVDFEPAEQAIEATGADIRHGGDRAFYRRANEGSKATSSNSPSSTSSRRRRSITPRPSTNWATGARFGSAGPARTLLGNSGVKSHRPTCWPNWACPRATT